MSSQAITTKDIVDKYMDFHNLKLYHKVNDGNDFAPLLPYVLMDVEFQLYDYNIKLQECSSEAKRIRGLWIKAYTKFNKTFLMAFNNDEKDWLIDKMDKLWDFAKDTIEECINDFASCFPVNHEQRRIYAIAILCNTISQTAFLLWGRVFRTNSGKPIQNIELQNIRNFSRKWLDLYYQEKENINLDSLPMAKNACEKMVKKVVEFLKEENESYN